jgi:hypothetical protein
LRVIVIAERESQKVQTRSFFFQAIDLQPKPAFQLRLGSATRSNEQFTW